MLPEVRAFLDQVAEMNAPRLVDLPLEEMREAFGASSAFDEAGPAIARIHDDTVPGPGGDIAIRLYDPTPGAAEPTRAMVYYHGGGFVVGTLDSHDGVCQRLAHGLNIPVIALDYRLAPEHPFPAAFDDAMAVTMWAAKDLAALLGREVSGLICCGDSAGGNLAAAVPLHLRETGGAPIDLQVLLYPVTDLAEQHPSYERNGEGLMLEKDGMEMFANAYCPNGLDRKDPRISPLYSAQLSHLPPAIVVVAELDPLHDEGVAYAHKLQDAGIPVTLRDEAGLLHGFYTMTKAFPTGLALTGTLIDVIKETLA